MHMKPYKLLGKFKILIGRDKIIEIKQERSSTAFIAFLTAENPRINHMNILFWFKYHPCTYPGKPCIIYVL